MSTPNKRHNDNRTEEQKQHAREASSKYQRELLADPIRRAEKIAKMVAGRRKRDEKIRKFKEIGIL